MESDSPSLLLPRELILLAFMWLVGAWLASIGVRQPIHPTPASYEPAVRMLLFLLMIGVVIGWPLYRLSQPKPVWPLRQTLLDIIVLLAMIQVVIWPLRLITTWSRERVAAMDAIFGAWLLIAGALIATSLLSRGARSRTIGMTGLVLLCVAGPTIAWFGAALGVDVLWLTMTSPLMVVHALGRVAPGETFGPDWGWITANALAAGLAWIAPFILAAGRIAASRAPR